MPFKENLLKFLKANGLEEDPEVGTPNYQPVEGYVPSEQLVWHRGSIKISVALSVVQETEAGALGVLEELQRVFGLPAGAQIPWQRIIDGEISQGGPVAANPIGFRVPVELVAARSDLRQDAEYFFNVGARLPEPGDSYKSAAGTFVAIAFGMFSRWWMKRG